MNVVSIASIVPNRLQPRRRFDQDSLLALSDSIAELGVLQPILVRPLEKSHDQTTPGSAELEIARYELIAGERRWRAAQLAGLDEVPVIVRHIDDKESLEQAVVENLHREDLNPMEEAAAYQRLVDDYELSTEEVARRVGKSRPAVANSLRLFQLPASVQRFLVDGQLAAGHGRALLGLPDPHSRQLLAEKTVEEFLSVRALERLVKRHMADTTVLGVAQPKVSPTRYESPALLEVEDRLANRLATRVTANLPKNGPGRLVIEFADIDDLGRIFDELEG